MKIKLYLIELSRKILLIIGLSFRSYGESIQILFNKASFIQVNVFK
jgi:hypothetical protein